MRYLLLLLISTSAVASIKQGPCNQLIYDAIYRKSTQDILNKSHTLYHKDFYERNSALFTLRQLCNGQRSSYEQGTILEAPKAPKFKQQ